MLYYSTTAGVPSPPSLFQGKAPHCRSAAHSPQRAAQPAAAAAATLTQENTQQETEVKDETIWVQCENKKCLKWRHLAKEAAGSLPDVWYCSMHPNPSLQSCDTPEEQWQLDEHELFTYHGLKEGELVWAKLWKYPP